MADWKSDKTLDREQKSALQNQRLDAQVLREQRKHTESIEKIRQAHDRKSREVVALSTLDRETAVTLKLLDQGLLPERLDLEFNDVVRRADIELQTLQAELTLQDELEQQQHARSVDYVYQSTMMEITKETARLLDEQNKAVAINQQETRSKLMLEAQQHQQTLARESQEHQHGMQRDVVQSELKKEEFTHEETIRLVVRMLARKWGLSEADISPDQVAEWMGDFEGGF
jgi:hypothetical protein